MDRRTFLAGIGSGALCSLAGCLGAAGMTEHVATPTGVEASAREETGYELQEVEELPITEPVDLAIYSEEIVVYNYLAEHEKSVDMGPLGEQRGAVFVVLATPQISIAGRQFNPVEDKSAEELVELVVANYDGLANVSHESDDEVTVLGESTTKVTFVADAEFDGQDVEVNLHVTEAVATADDLIVSIGVYPRELEQQERENVVTLIESISEDADLGDEQENGGDEQDGQDDEEESEEEDSDEEDGEEGDEEDEQDDEEGEDDDGLGV